MAENSNPRPITATTAPMRPNTIVVKPLGPNPTLNFSPPIHQQHLPSPDGPTPIGTPIKQSDPFQRLNSSHSSGSFRLNSSHSSSGSLSSGAQLNKNNEIDVNKQQDLQRLTQATPGLTGVLSNKLPNGMITCPFKYHGCVKMGYEKDVKVHIRDDRIMHLFQLCNSCLLINSMKKDHIHDQNECAVKWDSNINRVNMTIEKISCAYIFRIPNITQEIRNARKNKQQRLITSSIFESHKYGYNLMCVLAPFGDGEVTREYMSIFVAIVKGKYDAIQQWPFPYTIHFTAMATNGKDHFRKSISPNSIADNGAFLGRPKGERNAAFGVQKFVPLTEIDRYTIAKDLFIKIDVDLLETKKIRASREVNSSQCQGETIKLN